MARGPSAQAVQHRGEATGGAAPSAGRPRGAGGLDGQGAPHGADERGDHVPGRAAARPAAHRRQPRARHRRPRVGRRRRRRRSCSPTAGIDFAGTFDVFAPMLADDGLPGRVVGPPRPRRLAARRPLQLGGRPPRRGRRCSTPSRPTPVPVVGHSKGGSLMLQLADALPHRVSHLINLDGLPSRRQLPRRLRPPAHEAHGEGAHGVARPPPVARRRAAPAGHDRRAGRAPRAA